MRAVTQVIVIIFAPFGFIVLSAMLWHLTTGELKFTLEQTNCATH